MNNKKELSFVSKMKQAFYKTKLGSRIMHNKNIDENVKTDIMRYRPNKISFWFCILAIICNVAMFIIIYSEKNCTSNWQLGIDLLVNVVFMLACFLLSEKTKAYQENAGYVSFGVAAIQVLRIFWIPLFYYTNYLAYESALHEAESLGKALDYTGIIGLNHGQFIACVILLVISACALVGAGLVCVSKAKKLKSHIAELKRGN